MTELEIDLEERCVEHTKAHGGLALKLKIDGMRGFPDRTILVNTFPRNRPKVFFVEFKRRGKVEYGLARQQHKWHMILTALGFKVYTIDTDEAFDAALKENLR